MFHSEMGQVGSAMVELFVAAAAGELVGEQLPILGMQILDVFVEGLSVFETFVALIALEHRLVRLSPGNSKSISKTKVRGVPSCN